jgi:hypothetical protein
MANHRRGEVALDLAGRTYTLCLTLGALAELEAAFGVPDLASLGERFAAGRLSGRDLVALLGVALRGGGHPLSDAEVAALPLDGIEPLTEALARVVALAFGEPPGEGGRSENPPGGRRSPGTTPSPSASGSCAGARSSSGGRRRGNSPPRPAPRPGPPPPVPTSTA